MGKLGNILFSTLLAGGLFSAGGMLGEYIEKYESKKIYDDLHSKDMVSIVINNDGHKQTENGIVANSNKTTCSQLIVRIGNTHFAIQDLEGFIDKFDPKNDQKKDALTGSVYETIWQSGKFRNLIGSKETYGGQGIKYSEEPSESSYRVDAWKEHEAGETGFYDSCNIRIIPKPIR